MSVNKKLPESLNMYEFVYENDLTRRIDAVHNEPHYFLWINSAWAAMMVKQGILPKENVPKISRSILEFWDNPQKELTGCASLMDWIIERHGTEVAGSLTMGRTIPPLRQMLPVRHKLMRMMCMLYDLREALLDTAEKYRDTVMPGYTHIRPAQPMTFGHYLLSVYDPFERTMKNLEDSFTGMNISEMGCGALAGTSWNIDREMFKDYMGMDGIIENANDAVAYTDGYVNLISALANMMTIFSRFALDMNYWSGQEYGFMSFPLLGMGTAYSHFMPNKTESGTYLERLRIGAAELLGQLTEIVGMSMRAPHGDMHEMLHMADPCQRAIRSTFLYLHVLPYALPEMNVNKDRMLEVARKGYACATELSNQIVKDYGLDYRTAHKIVNKFVFDSKEKSILAADARIEILEAAAKSIIGRELGISEQTLRESLDPVHFVKVTNSQGGTAPSETTRMLKDRRIKLKSAVDAHVARIEKQEKAQHSLLSDLKEWAGQE